MNIFILGSQGFIGTSLKNYLRVEKKIFFQTIHSSNFKIVGKKIYIDLLNENHFEKLLKKKFYPDVIINLAWFNISNLDRKNCIINYKMSKNILNFANKANTKKIINTGSCFEYNNLRGSLNEKKTPFKNTVFSFYKKKIMNMFFKDFKNISIWCRLFYVYGPGQKKNSLIPLIMESIKYKKIFFCKKPFDVLDYVYVDDVSKSLYKLMFSNKSEIFNIASCQYTSNLDILNFFKLKYKKLFVYKVNNKQKKIKKFKGDNSKLKKIIKINFLSINQGLKKIINETN